MFKKKMLECRTASPSLRSLNSSLVLVSIFKSSNHQSINDISVEILFVDIYNSMLMMIISLAPQSAAPLTKHRHCNWSQRLRDGQNRHKILINRRTHWACKKVGDFEPKFAAALALVGGGEGRFWVGLMELLLWWWGAFLWRPWSTSPVKITAALIWSWLKIQSVLVIWGRD